MDYRNRSYYLAKINYFSYDMRMHSYYLAAPSLKIHTPYNHFKGNKEDYDGVYTRKMGYAGYWQMMLSCKKEDSESLEYELRKAERRDVNHWCSKPSYFLKLDKELNGL